jgi:uncharacterized protein
VSKESPKQIPIKEGYFDPSSKPPKLNGSRCKTCNHSYFPRTNICQNPKCTNKDNVEDIVLSNRGKLYTYSYEYYVPPPPFKAKQPFAPFGIGLVEFPEGVKVMGPMTDDVKLEYMKIGMDVEVVFEKSYTNEAGEDVIWWKYKPVKK